MKLTTAQVISVCFVSFLVFSVYKECTVRENFGRFLGNQPPEDASLSRPPTQEFDQVAHVPVVPEGTST